MPNQSYCRFPLGKQSRCSRQPALRAVRLAGIACSWSGALGAKNVRTSWCKCGLCLCAMTASQSSSKGGVATLDWRSSIGGIGRQRCRQVHHQTTAKLGFVPRKVTVRAVRTDKLCGFVGSPRVFPLLGKFSPLLLGRGFGSKSLIKTCGRNLMQSLQRGHVEGGRT